MGSLEKLSLTAREISECLIFWFNEVELVSVKVLKNNLSSPGALSWETLKINSLCFHPFVVSHTVICNKRHKNVVRSLHAYLAAFFFGICQHEDYCRIALLLGSYCNPSETVSKIIIGNELKAHDVCIKLNSFIIVPYQDCDVADIFHY